MFWDVILIIILSLLGLFALLGLIAIIVKPLSVYANKPEEKNPFEGKKVIFVEEENDKENSDGVKGHLETVGESSHKGGFYERFVKRLLDIILSFGGLVLLSPVFLFITFWIIIDDPGPVFFTQKRIGKN